jgi:hypothetical protein
MMTVERDFTTAQNKLARAAKAVQDARQSLNTVILGTCDHDAIVRDIDQFTAREACTVLAALRLFQAIQCQGGWVPPEIQSFFVGSTSIEVTRLRDLEHFETEAPLNTAELDDLCERIAVDFSR